MRWSEQDEETFRKLRKNYNAKIARIKKSNPELVKFLPSKLKKENIYSRNDFNTAKKYGEMFLKRDSQRFVPIAKKDPRMVPEFFKKQMRYITHRENTRRGIAAKKLTPEKGTMSLRQKADIRRLKTAPKGKQTDPQKRIEELSAYKRAIEEMHLWDSKYLENANLYRENYIIVLNDELEKAVPQPQAGMMARPIIELLRTMSVMAIFKAYEDYDMKLYIKFLYDIQEAGTEIKELYLSWCDYLGRQPNQQYIDMYDRIIDGVDYEKLMEG